MNLERSSISRSIVFDMDGVLVDSEQIVYRAWMKIGTKLGMTGMHDLFFRCMGTSHASTANLFYEIFGADFDYSSFRDQVRSCYLEAVKKNIPLKNGAAEILATLKDSGWKIALASSSRESSVMMNLKKSGLFPFFDAIMCGDMVANGKPAPDIYLKACALINSNPSLTYAVEDSRNGLLSAVNAGLKTILVPDMIQPDEKMRQMAWKIFPDLHLVLKFLLDNNS